MSKTVYYWWYAYGRFAPGENNLPHFGQVMRYYREIRGWSKEELATVLQCTVRYVEMLESSKNTNMPDLLSRRIAIARILQIPLILLGVSSVIEQGNTTDLLEGLAEASFSTDQRTFTMFERMLALCWDVCYTSSFQRAASDVAFCLDTLNDAAKHATGIQRDQVNAMRSRFYQLSGIIARDRMDFVQALDDGTKAVDLALELNNVELIAAAFEHRAGTYSRLKQQDFAFRDIKRALPYADRSRDVLKGNVYLEIALKSLQKPGNKEEKEKEVMGFLDEAGRIVRKGNLEEDGSFLKLNTASLHIERAKALTHFHRFQDAHNSYRIALKALSPGLISWQVNILIEEAETCLIENDIEACCEKAMKALGIIHSVQSRNREERIQKLYLRCQKKAPNNPQVYLLSGKLNALAAKAIVIS
jgi:transcriptional regulator with XRE-family HTH domain